MDQPEESSRTPFDVTHLRQYLVPLLLGAGSLLSIVFAVVLLVKSTQTTEPIKFSEGTVAGDSAIGYLVVDVAGAVGKPGVYQLPAGSRINDAIKAAGDLADNADKNYIARVFNLAQPVMDGGKIYVPNTDETTTTHNNGFATSAIEKSQNQGLVVTTSGQPSQNEAGLFSSNGVGLISINFASESQLDTLPGVGPVTAQKIINNRPYGALEELVTKKAVGRSVYDKIRAQISL